MPDSARHQTPASSPPHLQAPYDMRQDLHPSRLTIAMWDFSWLKGHYPGGPFEDWERCVKELRERGFNTVRIDAFPLLTSHYLRHPGLWHVPADPLPAWGYSLAPCDHDLPKELEQFMRICQKHEIRVILSTWGDGRDKVKERQAFWTCWEETLDFLKGKGLLEHVVYVDFDQEFPYFSPFQNEINALANTSPGTGATNDLLLAMEQAGQAAGSKSRFVWNPRQMQYVKEHMTSTLHHFQRRYPELRFTFSLTSFWKEVRALEVPLDVLELHVWIHEPRFDNRTGFNEISKNRGQPDLREYMRRLRAALQSSRPMLLKSIENRMKFAQEWSEEAAAPLVTTEAWGPWWHMDQKDLEWEWLYDWCEQCLDLAQQHGFWGVTTWNYAHPYWENWQNVTWYQRVNRGFLQGK